MLMEVNMTETGKMIKRMEKVYIIGQMEIIIQEIG